jgi:hypothetical protein
MHFEVVRKVPCDQTTDDVSRTDMAGQQTLWFNKRSKQGNGAANYLYLSEMKRVKMLMNIEDFHEKPEVKEAISNLSINPTPHNIKQGYRFLISSLIIDGGARPSVIQNIRLTEVDKAEQVEGRQKYILGNTSTSS